jgi:hypothetical protein
VKVGEEVVLATLALHEQPNCAPELLESFGALVNVIKTTPGYQGAEVKYNEYSGGLQVVRRRTEFEVREHEKSEAQRQASIDKWNADQAAKRNEQERREAEQLGIPIEAYRMAREKAKG